MIKQMMNANSRPMLAPCALTASIRIARSSYRDQSLRDDRSRRKAAGMMPQATLSQRQLVAAAGRCRGVAKEIQKVRWDQGTIADSSGAANVIRSPRRRGRGCLAESRD